MKIVGLIVGLAIAWALNKWAHGVLLSFANSATALTGVSAIVAVLTAPWGLAFGRLAVFEKLEDLTGDQRAIAISKAGSFRKAIFTSMAVNGAMWVATILLVVMSQTVNQWSDEFLGYWLLASLGLWLGGFMQSFKCIDNIESSRLAIASTQEGEKRRASYLKKLREDEAKAPVDHNDAHLKKYTDTLPSLG
jgi:uncharacterized membrane protein